MPRDQLEASYFSPDILEFIRLLHAHGVRYVVVGGEAVRPAHVDSMHAFSPGAESGAPRAWGRVVAATAAEGGPGVARGVYLRGIYEVQVADTYGDPLDSHNMGGIYSRIKPTQSAEKPFGQWQTMDMTLVNRHVTVVLN